MKAIAGLSMATCIAVLSGCISSNDITEVPVEVLYASPRCGVGVEEIRLTRLISMGDVSEFLSRVNSSPSKPRIPNSINLSANYLVLVELGRQSTGGYSLEVTGKHGQLSAGRLELPLVERRPLVGTVNTQALTSPCVLFQVPKNSVRIVSALGNDTGVLGKE